jgi:hypothetical protein
VVVSMPEVQRPRALAVELAETLDRVHRQRADRMLNSFMISP